LNPKLKRLQDKYAREQPLFLHRDNIQMPQKVLGYLNLTII